MAYFRCGGSGMPAGLQSGMDAVLNKKFGTSTTYPVSGWPDTVNLMGPLPEKTIVSSPVADFADGADDVPTKSLIVTIPASLSGVSSVTEKQTGRNLADFSSNTQDGEYHATISYQNNGASVSATGNYSRCAWTIPTIIGQTYTVSFSGVRDNEYGRVMFNDSATASGTMSYGVILLTSTETAYTKTFTATSNFLYLVIYNTGAGTTGNSTIKDVQLEYGSTAHAYEPYTTPTTYTASLGRTIYGGEVDIVNGEGQETYGLQTFDGTETWTLYETSFWYTSKPQTNVKSVHQCVTSNGVKITYTTTGQIRCYISDNPNVVDTETDMNALLSNGVSFNYQLNENVDFTFTGQEVPTRLGYNAFWSEQGDTEVTYRADINLLINNH